MYNGYVKKLSKRQIKYAKYLFYEKNIALYIIASFVGVDPKNLRDFLKKDDPVRFSKKPFLPGRRSKLNDFPARKFKILETLIGDYCFPIEDTSVLLDVDDGTLRYFLRKNGFNLKNRKRNALNAIIGAQTLKARYEKWERLAEEGLSNSEIARRCGGHHSTVSKYLTKKRGKLVELNLQKFIEDNPEKINQLLEYARQGYYIRAIAGKLKISDTKVSKIIHRELPEYFRLRYPAKIS